MSRELLMIEQLHISAFAPTGLSGPNVARIKTALSARRLWDKVRQTVQVALQSQRQSFKLKVTISR